MKTKSLPQDVLVRQRHLTTQQNEERLRRSRVRPERGWCGCGSQGNHVLQGTALYASAATGLLRRQLIPLAIQTNAIQRAASCDVQQVLIGAASKANVGWDFRLDVSQLFAIRRVNA